MVTVRLLFVLTARLLLLCAGETALSCTASRILFPGQGNYAVTGCCAALRVAVLWLVWWIVPELWWWISAAWKGAFTFGEEWMYRRLTSMERRQCRQRAWSVNAVSGAVGVLAVTLYQSLF